MRCPLQPEATPEAWPVHIHGHNGLGNHPVPAQLDVAAHARPAAQLIIDLVRAHPGEVTLVAVGRMTNLALALQQAPDIAGLVRGVVIMGGAFHVNGNITPAAEANIWGDAEAADVVFTTDWPVTAIGLDVTTRVEMDRDGLDTLAGIGGADAELVRALSQDYVDFYLQAGHKGMVVHDCCACIALTRPELFQFERASVRVATDGVARGMTIPKPEGMGFGPSVWDGHVLQSVAIGVDAAARLVLPGTVSGRVHSTGSTSTATSAIIAPGAAAQPLRSTHHCASHGVAPPNTAVAMVTPSASPLTRPSPGNCSAVAGAASTTSVDLSAPYLQWCYDNLALNGQGGNQHLLVQADAMAWLEGDRGQYDVIFCDPPTFSNSARADDFDVQREQLKLLRAAVARLAPGGVLYFSNNFRRFKLEENAIAEFAQCREITARTIGPDFERNARIHRAWELKRLG
ncbi:hypothetical protein G6F31_013629 [Rhizopus arrhizus]|nr:hypothetical protein G6F31_013629 [Rhizopus arrhizus]